MRGIGTPEIVVVIGLLLVLIAGFFPTGIMRGEDLVFSKYIGPLGGGISDYKHIELADAVSLAKGIEEASLLSQPRPMEVAKGIITTEEHIMEFSIPASAREHLSAVNLRFSIKSTNQYGALLVYLNNENIWSGFPEIGEEVRIQLPTASLLARNSLRILAGSSGWRVWAPTTYIIEGLQITEKTDIDETRVFSFKVSQTDLEKFYMARFFIGNTKPIEPGELVIVLNNELVIYKGTPPSGGLLVPFSTGVRENNTLKLEMIADGSYELINLEVIIFRQTNATSEKTLDFLITDALFEQISAGDKKARFELEIEACDDGSTLQVIAVSGDREDILIEGPAMIGKLSLSFVPLAPQGKIILLPTGQCDARTAALKVVPS
ncbi:MAG: hypothetical protein GOU99_00225 [Candidatus Altiarchaeota archaeon]|nr:hypothetical protein [Candidatus Altiarchaeota archaeon]